MSEIELHQQEYIKRLAVSALRRRVFEQTDPSASVALFNALQEAESELSALERQRASETAKEPGDGVIGDQSDEGDGTHLVRGPATTGLRATALLRMAQLPTSVYHLFDRQDSPLISCRVENHSGRTRRLRVTSFIEGYSARAVDTVELANGHHATFDQLPTLFLDRLQELHELTAATVNVMIEDLDGKIELHRTERIPLLARTTAPLAIRDPSTGRWNDLTRYFGAFVTPNAPAILAFLRNVADHHSDHRLVGYQMNLEGVQSQVEAVFAALQGVGITYVNSVVAFSPEEGTATQRVRLPRESLGDREANCIDGTVLFASILEALSMSPAIVVVPGHAFVAWETWSESGEWRYLETTMIGSSTFAQACASAEDTARRYQQVKEATSDPSRFRLWPLRVLRTADGITPME